MASLTEMLNDVKAHLEHGAELVASHVPALVEWATRVDSNPLVKTAVAAIEAELPEGAQQMIANLINEAVTEFAKLAPPPAPADPAPAEEPAA